MAFEEDVKNLLGTALRTKTGMQVIDVTATPTQIRLLARQAQSRIGDLVLVIHGLLTASQRSSWKVDISKTYFLKEGKVVQAIRFIIQVPEGTGPAAIEQITQIVKASQRSSRVEVDEIILPGASRDRHVQRNGRGAGPVGTVKIGR